MFTARKKRDNRKSMRQTAWIILDGGFAARTCTVLDLSETGAKISIDEPSTVATRLRLAFTRDATRGRHCEVIWRRGRTLGLKFIP
jgi:hypothetical protein